MRTWGLGLFILCCATGCKSDIVCCDGGDDFGPAVLTTRGECDDHDLPVVPDAICDGITDPDLDLDDDEDTDEAIDEPLDSDDGPSDEDETDDAPDDTDDTDTVLTEAERCTLYCEGIVEECPGDTLCEDSCNHSACPVTDTALACAAAATTCPETYDCWDDWLWDDPPAECPT